MVFTVFRSVWSLLIIISLILWKCLISTTAAGSKEAVSPVLDCELDNNTYICTGAQYRMNCNTRMHRFSYQRYQNQDQYQCLSNDCVCIANNDTCSCYSNTSSCFCENYGNYNTIPTAVSPVYDCGLYNDTYICTGAQYRMFCNTSVHDFYYTRNEHQCTNNICDCRGDMNTCTCSSSTSSSCFCTNYSSSFTIPSAVSPVYDCVLYNDMYICTGAQYRMFCNTRMHEFYYRRYQNQNQYQYCSSHNCDCRGNKDTCTCRYNALSSCFCETYGNNITVPTAVSPVTDPDCVLYNDFYICTGAQYRMFCNTSMHRFSYQRYQKQDQYHCWNGIINRNIRYYVFRHRFMSSYCNCIGDKDTCTCYSSTFSSCFCETYNNNITALTAAVTPVYGCVLYSNASYICTGAQYRMFCNMQDFHYNINERRCTSNNCDCRGNNDTCTCYSSTFSSCFCETYGNNTALTAAVSPVYDCVLHKDTYICTGAQYLVYCNTSVHDFHYSKSHFHCFSGNCDCIGNGDTCSCSYNTSSSCFCTNYSSSFTIPTAVSPVYDCLLHNDTYICTGAQYRMFCNTRMHNFNYRRYRNQNQYQYECTSHNCNCVGTKDTCTCSTSTFSSCFCETYGNNITIPTAVSPVNDCVLSNTTYICTGAQYRMFCNTSVHDLYYSRNKHWCTSENCDCRGNKDTCTCYSRTASSCFCEYNISSPTTLSPTTAGLDDILPDQCRSLISEGCLKNLLDNIENIAAQELPLGNVTTIFDVVLNTSEISDSAGSKELVTFGNRILKASEKLISALVKPTDTSANFSFTLTAVEAQVFMIGPNFTADQIPQLVTNNASMDIDLVGIAKSNNGTTAVIFVSYTTMENLLKPELFNTSDDTIKTMMSTVISATLPKTTNTKLTKPVNFTLKHIRELDPSGSLSCVYWSISEWIVDGCSVLKTNSSFTVCSCVHLSTFALIMQTSRPSGVQERVRQSDSELDLVNLVCVIVGLVFFSLALLTFAFCQWSPGVNNVARINICVSLLLAHLLLLLTQQFLSLIRRQQVLCTVISGVLHFLFLSGFVWMSIEAVLLFICVKNLSQISSKKREVLSSGFLCVIGYTVALVVVSLSVGLFPERYGSEHCWIKIDFIWTFLGPVCVILALNMILFISITISLCSTLTKLNAKVSQMKQTKIRAFKTLAQFVVLGCSWILGFFTKDSKTLEILFLILNSQQGTFIFLIYCVLNDEVRQQYRKCFRCLCSGRKHNNSKSVQKKC